MAQLVMAALQARLIGPISRRRGFEGLCIAATGLGKLAFADRFRGHHYGARCDPAPLVQNPT